MKAKKRLEIIWETHEITTFSFKQDSSLMFFCEICQLETRHLTAAQTAVALKISEINVFRLAIDGKFHLAESTEGKLLICKDSQSFSRKIN